MNTIITGIKPTGIPHLGNLIGSIKPAIALSKSSERTLIFIADLHALNSGLSPNDISLYTKYVASAIIESDVDFDKVSIFRQSDIPEVHQLAMFLMNVTSKGLLNRAHSYKDIVSKNIIAGRDNDHNVNMGLFTYPVLMAADILIYGADAVPVGKDQKQHLDIARDLAKSFNSRYGETFKIPEAIISSNGDMIPGIDGQKMSKSYNNTISLFASDDEVDSLCKKIKTDSKNNDDVKDPESLAIYQIYKHFGDSNQFKNDLLNGMGYGEAKTQLASVIKPITQKYRSAFDNHDKIDLILENGQKTARQIAKNTLLSVKNKMLGS